MTPCATSCMSSVVLRHFESTPLTCILWFDHVWPSSYFKTQRHLTSSKCKILYLLVQLPLRSSQKSAKFMSVGCSNDGTDFEIEVVRAWQQKVVLRGFLDCFLYLPLPPLSRPPSPVSCVDMARLPL